MTAAEEKGQGNGKKLKADRKTRKTEILSDLSLCLSQMFNCKQAVLRSAVIAE